MKTLILSLALSIVLAGPASAYAIERAYVPAASHQIVDYWGAVPHGDPFPAPELPAARGAGSLTCGPMSSNINCCNMSDCVGVGGG